VALRAGARLLIINLEGTDCDAFAEVVLRGPAGVLLPALVRPDEAG
jgi:hypothetical protein